MDNNIKFTLIVDKLDRKISELNIKLSKNPNDNILKKELNEILIDKNSLYKGTIDDIKKIIEKYGDTFNE